MNSFVLYFFLSSFLLGTKTSMLYFIFLVLFNRNKIVPIRELTESLKHVHYDKKCIFFASLQMKLEFHVN